MDEATCLSERALRYGRNIMILCFIACGVKFFTADFSNANIFGIKVKEQQFWSALLILLLWHVLYFLVLVYDDIKKWWDTYVAQHYPSSKFVMYLRTPPKSVTVGKIEYTFTDHPTNFQWMWQQNNQPQYINAPFFVHKQIRRTIFRVLLLDGGAPILFSLFTTFVILREWLTLSVVNFIKAVMG